MTINRRLRLVLQTLGIGLASAGCSVAHMTELPAGRIEQIPLPFLDEFVSSRVTEIEYSLSLRHSAQLQRAPRRALCVWDGAGVHPFDNVCVTQHRVHGGGNVYLRHGVDCDWLLFQWGGRNLRIPVPSTLNAETQFEIGREGCIISRTSFYDVDASVLLGEICIPEAGDAAAVEWYRSERSWIPPATWFDDDGITRLADTGDSFSAEYHIAGIGTVIRGVRRFDGEGRTSSDVDEIEMENAATLRLETLFARSDDGVLRIVTRTVSNGIPTRYHVIHSQNRVFFSTMEPDDAPAFYQIPR
jgi:hypothetical protein